MLFDDMVLFWFVWVESIGVMDVCSEYCMWEVFVDEGVFLVEVSGIVVVVIVLVFGVVVVLQFMCYL